MRIACALTAILAVVVGSGFASFEAGKSKKDEPRPIKAIMKEAMKSGLAKKVADGEATDEEKMKFLDMMIDLVANEPPKGDDTEWKMMAGPVMMNAAKVVVGREDGAESLKKSMDCKACHDIFK